MFIRRSFSPWACLPTGESQNTRYTGWCPGWCWPTVGLPDHSHNSWHCQGYTGLAAVHFLLSIIYLLTQFQNPGFLWMEMISYPASKRIKNYLRKKKKEDCNTTLNNTYSKQKLLINKLKAYYGLKLGTVLSTGDSRMKRYSFLHQLAFSRIGRNILILKNNST